MALQSPDPLDDEIDLPEEIVVNRADPNDPLATQTHDRDHEAAHSRVNRLWDGTSGGLKRAALVAAGILKTGGNALEPAIVGTGTRNGSRFLRDDGAWAAPPAGTGLDTTGAPNGSVPVVTGGTIAFAQAFRVRAPDADGIVWFVDENGEPLGFQSVTVGDPGDGGGGDDGSAWATKVAYSWDTAGIPATLGDPWVAAVGGVNLVLKQVASQSALIPDAFGSGKPGWYLANDWLENDVENNPAKAVAIPSAPPGGVSVFSAVVKDLVADNGGSFYYMLDTITGSHRTDPPDNLWQEFPGSHFAYEGTAGAGGEGWDVGINTRAAIAPGTLNYTQGPGWPGLGGVHVVTMKLRGVGMSTAELDGTVVASWDSSAFNNTNKIMLGAFRVWGGSVHRGNGTYGRAHVLIGATEAEATASVAALKAWGGVA